jgi:hypothetical protein
MVNSLVNSAANSRRKLHDLSYDGYKNIAERFVDAYQNYEDYNGASQYKHMKLFKWYKLLVSALKDPVALI